MIIVEQRYLFMTSLFVAKVAYTVVVRFHSANSKHLLKVKSIQKNKTITVFIKIYDSIIYLQNIFLITKI
jgi:hypothetical protein